MITIRGCVIRVLQIKHLAQWIVFSCINCKVKTIVKQADGIYTVPMNCDTCERNKFQPVLNSPYTKTVPFQDITLQESFNDKVIIFKNILLHAKTFLKLFLNQNWP